MDSAHTTALLLSLADSRLPTGSHVHSGGVEEAIAQGLVRDCATLMAYLRRRIRTHGLVAGFYRGRRHYRSAGSGAG